MTSLPVKLLPLRSTPFGVALLAALGAAAILAPAPAEACGGFFCDSSRPVNQQAERIIFAHEADGSVTAVIQIQYQGPAERFAWMLPVAGSPEIAVSSNAAFDRIQQASNPTYRLDTRVEGSCGGETPLNARSSAESAGDVDAGTSPDEQSGVSVVDRGSVGPYDYVIIHVDPEAPDLVAIALDWLRDNGYDVPDLGSEVLRPYLESGMNLLAFRLTKGNDAGAIRPVRLSFGPGLPSIPLRPTAVAAEDDMGILVWILGESRAIPANYRALELNEVLIDWFNPGSTYNDVVTRAANEAMGQGFVTEMAGPAATLGRVIWQPWEADGWADINTQPWEGREGALLLALSNYASLDGMREVLREHLTVPDGLTEDQFFACLACYIDSTVADIESLDPAALLAAMQENVVDPLLETQDLFEQSAYVTRLYTTMSAHEMTVDPVFDFNPDLGDVSNQHVAERIIECSPSLTQFEAPWRIVLANGDVIRGEGRTWPFATDTEAMPASARIMRVGTSGEGEVIEDNADAISQALTRHNATVARRADRGGCTVNAGRSRGETGFAVLAGLVIASVVRRRRR